MSGSRAVIIPDPLTNDAKNDLRNPIFGIALRQKRSSLAGAVKLSRGPVFQDLRLFGGSLKGLRVWLTISDYQNQVPSITNADKMELSRTYEAKILPRIFQNVSTDTCTRQLIQQPGFQNSDR